MPAFFNKDNAKDYAAMGGSAKRGEGFKQRASKWIKDNGFDKAISWIEGKSDKRATFAMGLLFNYALGRPTEHLQIEDKREILIRLVTDPTLNELAKRFGSYAGGIRKVGDSGVGDGESEIQAISPADGSV